ncbi:hypothetical protein [Streptomyces sp. NPDC015131]|uniref:hypothetical protein n=1 Tax=Streptomyces sp. NPDC015131 TaxID=3364941 RepID=UPI0036FB85BC
MTSADPAAPVPATPAAARLEAALHRLRLAFAGATARPDESNCPCHWGSEEELDLLKTPDVPLDPDLLHRTWSAPDWHDHAAVTRRILPQFARALVAGECRDDGARAGHSLARSGWRRWPEAPVVGAFLDAWWDRTLQSADPPVPAPEVFEVCLHASGTAAPWLARWERHTGPAADAHLLAAAREWIDDLEHDDFPFPGGCWYDVPGVYAYDDEEAVVLALNTWLARHARPRLAARGAPRDLLDRLTLLGVPWEWRWDSR